MVLLPHPRARFAELADGDQALFVDNVGAANVGRSLPRARFAIVTPTARAT